MSLTTGTDNITGTSGNDTISGVLQGDGTNGNGTGTTIQPGDVINGGSGTDTLNISVSGNAGGAYSLNAVNTTSVEKVMLSNFDANAADTTISTSLMTGLTTVGMSSSSTTGGTVFAGMQNMVDAEMRSGAGSLTLTYDGAQVVTGTADVQNLTVSNDTAGTFTANGIETINIKSESGKSTLTAVASNAMNKVVITGDKDLKITNALDFASNGSAGKPGAVVDASAFTGALTITTTASEIASITGGSGNDSFTMGSLTKDDTVDGGAGTDTLIMTAAALTDQFTKVSNIETVGFAATTANATMDVSKLSAGVTTVQLDVNDTASGNTGVTGTISNLAGQSVVLKNTAGSSDNAGGDGTSYTITNKTDTNADSISVKLDAINSIANNKGVQTLNVANFETINLQSAKDTAGTVTTNEVATLTASSATSITLTGDVDTTTIGALNTAGTKSAITVDGSALTGKLNVTFGSDDKVKVTAAQKDSVIAFGATLNNDDQVIGGAGKDTLTASVSGLTATTGKLNVSGVETITLTTGGDNTLDLSAVTGATTVAVSANTQTITGLDLATTLQLTDNATVKVTAANATGTNDTLTVEQKLNGDVSNTIEAKGGAIENLAIIMNDTGATANTGTFVLTGFEGTKVTTTQAATSATDTNIALGTLYKTVTTVDTSAMKGTQAFSVANATAAVTANLSGAAAATVTGSAFGDTFNINQTTSAVHAITGGNGTDTVNITMAATTAADYTGLDVEKVNITVNAGDDVTVADTKTFHTTVTDITLKGGNSQSTYTQGPGSTIATTALAAGVKTFDASAFGGNVVLAVVNDNFDDTVTITGGALTTDSVAATYATAGTYKPKTVGIETLKISAGNNATAQTFTVDLSNTTGVKTVEVNNIATSAIDTVVVDKITDQKIVVTGSGLTGNKVQTVLTDATGATDSVSIEVKNGTGPLITGTLALVAADIETVNLKASGLATTVDLSAISMTDTTKYAKVVVTGDKALTISALNANVNAIDASGMTTGGSVVQSARSGTSAADYKGTDGNDTFIMANGADVIAAGAGTDTLYIAYNQVLGGLSVDLSATGDQVTTFNGSANAAVQSGFENVNLSNINGTFGAEITANSKGSTITGTKNNDQINLGAGSDTINFLTASGNGSDTITGFTKGTTAGDVLNVSGLASLVGSGTAGGVASTNLVYVGATNAVTKGDTAVSKVVVIGAADNAATDWNNVVSKISGALTISADTTAGNATTTVLISNGTDTRVYLFADDATSNTTVESTELTLVGTLSGVTSASFVEGNFALS